MQPVLVLTWRWVHELLRVVAEQSILDVATAHTAGPWRERERWTLELGSVQPGGRCWSPSSSGSDKKCRAWPGPCPRCAFWADLWCLPALEEALCALGMPISIPSWREECCLQNSLAGLDGLPMPMESTTNCSVPTVWECLLCCNCRAASNRDFP